MVIRKALYAGSFYPSGATQLESMLKKILLDNKPNLKKLKISPKTIKAIIVPHAGYVYSGITASFAYNALSKTKKRKIILIGPSHHEALQGIYCFNSEWVTPIGKTKALPLQEVPVIENDSEHSLEVQLPFLQTIFSEFEFFPLLYGDISCEKISEILAPLSIESIIIASSDLSHFMPYEQAKIMDNITIDAILSLDIKTLKEKGNACGLIGIIALCLLAKKFNWKPVLLDYKNSGDMSGNKKGVVGYASIIFTQ